jgi:DNA polymerase-1
VTPVTLTHLDLAKRKGKVMGFGKGHHLHLIDGSAFIFRAYHALPPLTRKSDGLPIGAVAGFCNMLHRYIESNTGPEAPTHVAVVFDKGSHTFRNDLYDQYKANRDAMPEDLRPQMPQRRSTSRVKNSRDLRLTISSRRCRRRPKALVGA